MTGNYIHVYNMTWYGVATLKRQDKKIQDILYIVTVHHVY